MVAPQTKPSTRKLSEVARHVVIPSDVVSTGWPAVEKRCAEFGDSFDEWQRGAGKVILGKRNSGEYAATVGGVTLSIPRQVAKTFLIGRIVFALCTLFPGLQVIWTAHRTRTTSRTFSNLKGYASRKAVAPYIDAIRSTNGEQEIRFKNGSLIAFGAREQGFGRGFDEVDIEVFDEAQILTERALEDMVAATNQSRHVHGALIIYMGTPPRPVDPGEVFKARRREALSGESEDAVYIECSADPDADPEDRAQWAKANPSYPHRTPVRSMMRLRKNLPAVDSWRREALGIWDDDREGSRAISSSEWSLTGVDAPPKTGVKYFGVAFSIDGDRVALSGAVKNDDGVYTELVDAMTGDTETGVTLLAAWLAERADSTARIVISGKAGAVVLAQALRKHRVSSRIVHVATTPDYFAACAVTLDAIKGSARVARLNEDGDAKVPLPFTHLAIEGQSQLDESVAACDKVSRGRDGSWGWTATTEDGDETPIESMSLAVWAALTEKRTRTGKAVFG